MFRLLIYFGFTNIDFWDAEDCGDNAIPTNFGKRNTNINGTWNPNRNRNTVYTAGALRTSFNLSTISDSGSITETSKEKWEIDKLVPAITLRYIRKSNSYKTITTQTSE